MPVNNKKTCTMEYYVAAKKSEMKFEGKQMDAEKITLREFTKTQKTISECCLQSEVYSTKSSDASVQHGVAIEGKKV